MARRPRLSLTMSAARTGHVSGRVLAAADELVHTIAGVPFDFYYFKATGAAANNVLLAEVSGVTAAVPEPAPPGR